MTLTDFANMLFSDNSITEPYVYVFDTEDSMDSFANRDNDYELLFTLRSDFKCSMYLKEKYANAMVKGFIAVGKNQVCVWIEAEGDE